MKNRNKVLLAVLAIACVLVLAACAGQNGTTGKPDPSTTAGQPEPTTTVGQPDQPTGNQPHEHVFGDWRIVTEATCTADGLKERTCACGEKQTEVIPSTGHGATEVRDAKAANCNDEGYTGDTYCTVCNEKLETGAAIPATGHDYQGGICSACGEKEALPSTGLEFERSVYDGCYYVCGIGTCTDTYIIIPSTYDGFPVTGVGEGAFEDCSNLTGIVIPDSVTSIGLSAFNGCSSLTSIVIPDSVTSIGGSAFYDTAYYNDPAAWTDGVLYIGNYLIRATTDISGAYIIRGGTKCIADRAFSYCCNLTSIEIPNGVTTIGESAFDNCNGLTSATIGNGMTSIGGSAFFNCTSLTNIEIPDSVISIGHDAFYRTAYYNDPAVWTDGVLYIGNHLILAMSDISGAYTIRAGTKSIASRAFYFCSSLTGIVIPDSVVGIAASAFAGCDSLMSIVIPDGVTSIGDRALYSCDSLMSIAIPDSVTSVGYEAFAFCRNLTSIAIPDSVTRIGYQTFAGCSKLTSIEIPDSVTSIGLSAFNGCSSLTSIIIPDSVTIIDDFAFSWCEGLTNVTIGNGVTYIGWWSFRGCSSLTSITFSGTKAQWDAIEKDEDWDENTGAYTIHCTDGDIQK